LLANGLCKSLCLIDVNPDAVNICKQTIKQNSLEDKVTIYCSDGLSNIPVDEKWDLVVSNPPHFNVEKNCLVHEKLIAIDKNWKIHHEFYNNIEKFLKPNGSVLFQENIEGSNPRLHYEFIKNNNMRIIDYFWYRKFDSAKYIKWIYSIFEHANPSLAKEQMEKQLKLPPLMHYILFGVKSYRIDLQKFQGRFMSLLFLN